MGGEEDLMEDAGSEEDFSEEEDFENPCKTPLFLPLALCQLLCSCLRTNLVLIKRMLTFALQAPSKFWIHAWMAGTT